MKTRLSYVVFSPLGNSTSGVGLSTSNGHSNFAIIQAQMY